MVEKNVEGKDLSRKVATEISVQVNSLLVIIKSKKMMDDEPLNLNHNSKFHFNYVSIDFKYFSRL